MAAVCGYTCSLGAGFLATGSHLFGKIFISQLYWDINSYMETVSLCKEHNLLRHECLAASHYASCLFDPHMVLPSRVETPAGPFIPRIFTVKVTSACSFLTFKCFDSWEAQFQTGLWTFGFSAQYGVWVLHWFSCSHWQHQRCRQRLLSSQHRLYGTAQEADVGSKRHQWGNRSNPWWE